MRVIDKLPERIRKKIRVDPDGCWRWLGYCHPTGYGQTWDSEAQRKLRAHTYVYRLLRGDVPKGKELDHLCRVPACVNPEHLEPVTHRENTMRGGGPTALNARKTHCKRGHALTGDNLYIFASGSRACRECIRQHGKLWQREKRKRDREQR